ncbi:hypothetical protein M758_11G145200 [Ceratodon purpureus]|nr:hypothetical protein M758_11G145200 [Ceratodon purpureus]
MASSGNEALLGSFRRQVSEETDEDDRELPRSAQDEVGCYRIVNFFRSCKKFIKNLCRPAFDSRRDIAIHRLRDGSVWSCGWFNALTRSQECFDEDVVWKIRINDEDFPDFSISNLSSAIITDAINKGEVDNCLLTAEEDSSIFNKLQDGKNKVALFVEGRPTLKIDALIYRWSWNSTGHTRPCCNGAEDIIFIEDESDGSVRCFGWFLSLSNSAKCLRKADRTTDVKIRINGRAVPGFSIKLDRLTKKPWRRGDLILHPWPIENLFLLPWRGVPMEDLTPEENKQIFEHLHEGRNSLTLYIENRPDSEIDARIFKWRRNSKVVIVDIDNTATKSNGWGMYNNFTGEYYLRSEIPLLLLYLKLQGYKILYLTARPISTIHATRKYLADNLWEFLLEDFKKLPDGAVLTCCLGRLHCALHYVGNFLGRKEFISHQDFKTDLLSKIRSDVFRKKDVLFAGFGDTKSDFESYSSAGIPKSRNFQVLENGAIQFSVDDKDDSNKVTIAMSKFLERVMSLSDGTFPRIPSDDMDVNFCDNFISQAPPGIDIEVPSDFFSYHQYRLFDKGAHIFKEQMEWRKWRDLSSEERVKKREEILQQVRTWLSDLERGPE